MLLKVQHLDRRLQYFQYICIVKWIEIVSLVNGYFLE